MATNHEIEFKQMITASIYNKLQEKYFKDTSKGWSIRIQLYRRH